ncbi:MAG: WD40/YVTN/BNR-like repeat-containing protein [Nitrospiria bacterium]
MTGFRTIFILFTLTLVINACSHKEPTVFTIAINPSNTDIMYLATMKGVYKSRDGGETWEFRSQGLGDAHVLSLGIDPLSSSTVYAGTFGDAIYKTQDGGQQWYPANIGLKGHVSVVNGFAFYPKDPRIIFTATTVGVFKSPDEGKEWIEKVGTMESVYAVSLQFDPHNSNLLFVGTSGGMYKSGDLGENWDKKNDGLIKDEVGSAMSLGVNSILMNPNLVNDILVGTTAGIYRSHDGGEHWSKINKGIGSRFVIGLVINENDGKTVYAGTDQGIFKSVDGGESWVPKNTGLDAKVVRSIALNKSKPEYLFAGTQNGLYKSTNGGENWKLIKEFEK